MSTMETPMTTTTKTVTTHDIRMLRTEGVGRDLVQMVLCDIALDEVSDDIDECGSDGWPDWSGGGWDQDELDRAARAYRQHDQESALAECTRVILAARSAS